MNHNTDVPELPPLDPADWLPDLGLLQAEVESVITTLTQSTSTHKGNGNPTS